MKNTEAPKTQCIDDRNVLAVRNRAVFELNMMMQRHRHLQKCTSSTSSSLLYRYFLTANTASSFSSLSSKSLSIDPNTLPYHQSTHNTHHHASLHGPSPLR